MVEKMNITKEWIKNLADYCENEKRMTLDGNTLMVPHGSVVSEEVMIYARQRRINIIIDIERPPIKSNFHFNYMEKI